MVGFIKSVAQNLADAVFYSKYANRLADHRSMDKGTQILLSLKYQEMQRTHQPLPAFDDIGFRIYSQTDEDGILLYLFSLLGTTNKKVVEAGVEQGIECNSANLILNHGWQGLLIDGSAEKIRQGKAWYARNRNVWIWPPTLISAWIDAENINRLIMAQGFQGEIDLLSIDIDGMDYWVWKAIYCINPRVVVIECQPAWGSEKAVAIPYQADFERWKSHADYYGASLPALVKLARQKGYRLVGCNRHGFNAFFLRADVGETLFPEVTPEQCLRHPWAIHAHEVRLKEIAHLAWVEV